MTVSRSRLIELAKRNAADLAAVRADGVAAARRVVAARYPTANRRLAAALADDLLRAARGCGYTRPYYVRAGVCYGLLIEGARAVYAPLFGRERPAAA